MAALSGFGAGSLGEDVSPLPSSGSTAKPAPKLGRCHRLVMATRGDPKGAVSEVTTGASCRCFARFHSKSFEFFCVSPSRMVTTLAGQIYSRWWIQRQGDIRKQINTKYMTNSGSL